MNLKIEFQILEKIGVHDVLTKVLNLRKDLDTRHDVFLPQKITPFSSSLNEEGARTLALLSPIIVAGRKSQCIGNLSTLFVLQSVCAPNIEVPVLRVSGLGQDRLEALAAAGYFLPQFAGGYRDPEFFFYFLADLVGKDRVDSWTKDIFKTKADYIKAMGLNRSTLDNRLKDIREAFDAVLPHD